MFPSFDTTAANDCAAARSNNRAANVVCTSGGKEASRRDWRGTFFDGMEPFTRFWGVLTAIVSAGVGVDLAFHRHQAGYYIIGGSVFILLAEVLWIATLFIQLTVRSDSKVWKYWSKVTWFSGWKKTLAYAPMGAVPLIWPQKLWLCYVAGGQLIALSLFHLILSLRTARKRRRRKDRLLNNDVDSFESSKFEEVTEVLDDGLPEPIPGSSHSICDSLVDADTVLEI